MRRLRFPKPYADIAARLRVPFGFALVAAFAWLAEPARGSLALGLPVAAGGLLLRAWAAGHLAKNTELAVTGPYGYTRNPLYLGTLIVAAGLVLAARRLELALLFGTVIELEEQHLRKLFPAYADYAARVPLLLPRWPRYGERGVFRRALYLRNQEYNALAGFLAGAAWLVWRACNA